MGRLILSIATAISVAFASAIGGAQPAPPAPPAPKPAIPPAPKPAIPPAPKPATPPAAAKSASKLPVVEQATLANGLRLAVLHNDAAPVVAVQLWYRAGSKDEARDRRGTAHMMCHKIRCEPTGIMGFGMFSP